jgi:glycosyltransferase involved in cell wall biosynthesis
MENGIINVTNGLSAERFRVSICALDSSETFSQRIRQPGFECRLVPKHGQGIDWPLVRRLAGQLRELDADLVHSHNWGTFIYAVLAAKLSGIPIVHGEHGKNPNEMDGDGALKALTKKILGRRVRCIVTVSQSIAAEWKTLGIPGERIRWIPNGVDIQRFRPRDDARQQRRRFGLPEDGFVIGSVGRLDALKNYGVAIEAISNMRNTPAPVLALLGTGVEENNLRKQAADAGIADRVFFLGRHGDPENFLAALDIFVLPSKTEGMSNVVLEAMASGLPMICADLPAHREVFEPGEEGIMLSPCRAQNLEKALSALSGDTNERRRLGVRAREKAVSRFSLSRMVADYEKLYEEFAPTGANELGHGTQAAERSG